MLRIRQFEAARDYPTVAAWWAGHGWEPVPEAVLPPTGYVVEFVNKPIVAGWLYRTDSAIAWLEWVISDPTSTPGPRNKATDRLISTASEAAKALGHTVIFSSLTHPRLIQRYENHGFKVTETQMTNLIKVI